MLLCVCVVSFVCVVFDCVFLFFIFGVVCVKIVRLFCVFFLCVCDCFFAVCRLY